MCAVFHGIVFAAVDAHQIAPFYREVLSVAGNLARLADNVRRIFRTFFNTFLLVLVQIDIPGAALNAVPAVRV